MRARVIGSVVVACAVVAGAIVVIRKAPRTAPAPTFSKDIAPLVFARCAPCHHPGGAGPFSLLAYEDVTSHASEIRKVTNSRFMPPWRPAAGYAEYKNDRSLSAEQIALLTRWIDSGTPLGDPREIPAPPARPGKWQLGEPDLVVQLPAPYSLAADGTDVYRNLVIPRPVDAGRYVKAWDFSAGTRVIHHAIMNLDRYGLARRRDELDPGPGFGGMDVGDVQSADGFYLVWTPGKFPTPPDPASAFRVDAQTDFVLQLHMQPSGKPEAVNPTIGLYFSDRPPTTPRFTLRLGDPPLDIPAGEAHYVARSDYTLPTAVDVLTVFPHAHYVAKHVRTWATLPDGTERGLLKIDDWDFNWQDEYTFARPIQLPAGTKISVEFVYDNSSANVRNPSRPPRRVTLGERSTDEMGNVTFQVVPREPAGMNMLRVSKYERALAASKTARNHYNLANALADVGKRDLAIEHYRSAIELEPALGPAHENLGILLVDQGKVDDAIVQFRTAVKAQPGSANSYVHLGNALKSKHDVDGAIMVFREATAADAKSSLAHNSLGLALAEKGEPRAAVDSFRAALAIEPDDWMSHHQFAQALRATGAKDEAISHYRRALALRPDAREPADALASLLREADAGAGAAP